jgi:A/G-specific adenine glycosylase
MDINKLEKWYLQNHRKLSFRESKDPYQVWVSEIMLQQTQVEAVIPYFNKLMTIYPTVFDLAKSDDEKLQKDVEGLGYYRRFRNMKKAAVMIVDKYHGIFPKEYQDVLSLPGIGKYTAGAIMSICYNQPFSALDGNVIRVLSRYLGISDDMRVEKNKKNLDAINQKYIEKSNPNIYTQSMMELGALICRPRNPKCESCPLNENCVGFQQDIYHSLPYLSKLKEKKEYHFITLIIRDQHGLYLRKRDEELLYGMYEYPQFQVESIETVKDILNDEDIIIRIHRFLEKVEHVFTHQVWYMDVYEASLVKGIRNDWTYVLNSDFKNIPMAVAHRKIKG